LLENFRFQFWPWFFPDRTECLAVFSNRHRAKNFRFCPFWEIARGVNPEGWPVTRHIRSSDPRILTRKCCDRFRSVGAYWVVSQSALCSPLELLRHTRISPTAERKKTRTLALPVYKNASQLRVACQRWSTAYARGSPMKGWKVLRDNAMMRPGELMPGFMKRIRRAEHVIDSLP
jgi:hypothetical protein